MARVLWPVRSMATRSGTLARIRLRAAVRRQSWRKRVGTPAAWQAVRTPCASGGRGCRRGGRRAGCQGRGAPGGAPGPRQWGARSGEFAPPTCASRIPNSLGRIRPTCVASAQCGPRRRTEAKCTRLSVLARQAAVAVERLAASGRLPVACVAVSARQTAASVAVGSARGDHWPDERVALSRVVVVYPRGAEPGLARPARRRRRCLQRTTACRARRRQPGSLLASSWRHRGRFPVAPARSEAEAAANAHILVGDVSQDVVEITTGLTPRAQVLQPLRLITASPVIPIGFPPLVVRSVQHTVGRSASQTVITARPASAVAGNITAE